MTDKRKAPPYGYRWVGDELKENEKEQKTIEEVIRMRHKEHLSHSQISQELCDLGHSSRSGEPMTRHNVAYLIKNVLPRRDDIPENNKDVIGKGTPYGWMWSGSNELIENPYEQGLLLYAIELRKSGLSYLKISRKLADGGYQNRAKSPVRENNVAYWFRHSVPYFEANSTAMAV